jgi:hypothetical protein
MFHCVYFWLKKDLSAADRATFESELVLVTKLPYLALAKMGKPAAVEARAVCDLSFDWSLVIEFKEDKDHDFYQADCPDHKRFVETCKGMWDKVIIYDMTPQ